MTKNRTLGLLFVAASTMLILSCQTTPQKSVETTTPTVQQPTAADTKDSSNIQPQKVEMQPSKIEKKTRLKWDAYTADKGKLAGFRLYLRTDEGKAKLLMDIKNPKTTEVPLAKFKRLMNDEKANYLYLTAYDKDNKESPPSEAVCLGKLAPDSTLNKITNKKPMFFQAWVF